MIKLRVPWNQSHIEGEFDNVVEAAEFIRALANGTAAPSNSQMAFDLGEIEGSTVGLSWSDDDMSRQMSFLQGVAKAKKGILTRDLAKALGMSDARGIGGIMAGLGRRLNKLDLKPTSVVRKRKTKAGLKYSPGPEILKAIKLLEMAEILEEVGEEHGKKGSPP
ncbi:MAG: hypothetical protein V3V49_11555 [Candidatus Krumholzibacteria bacterium]